MLIIDRFAYTNRFTSLHPYLKSAIFFIALILSLVFKDGRVLGTVAAVMIALTVLGAKIPLKPYLKMLAVPFIYLAISILTLVVSFGFGKVPNSSMFLYLKEFRGLNLYLGIAHGALKNGMTVGLKAISAIVSMYFFILTTPCNQQVKVWNAVKVPQLFIELYVLTYRFIAIFFEEAMEIHRAQEIRFGYKGYKNGMRSLAILLKMLFIRVMTRYKDMQDVLEIKHFDGNFYTV